MPTLTRRFTVVPVAQRDDGWLACDSEAVECATADDAAKVAKILARKPGYCAAVAFARTGDITTGKYCEAEIIRRVGDLLVPEEGLGRLSLAEVPRSIDPKKGP
jgi:hypothetical protein